MLVDYGPGWTPPTQQTQSPGPAASAPPDAAAAASAVTIGGRVSKLAELHAARLITDDEFAARKAERLGS
jgi:hypothetical protein